MNKTNRRHRVLTRAAVIIAAAVAASCAAADNPGVAGRKLDGSASLDVGSGEPPPADGSLGEGPPSMDGAPMPGADGDEGVPGASEGGVDAGPKADGATFGNPDAEVDAGPKVDAGPTKPDAGPLPDGGGAPLVVTNFDANGKPVPRRDTSGKQLDAHGGLLAHWGSLYYLYGETYGCGFGWQQAGTPFCGFRVYTSPDLVNWTDHGLLFDATTATWQKRCNGSTYGCFRPKVVYNASTQKYVLWINGYDNVSGYHVFDGDNPAGPFTEVAEPHLGVNASAPPGGLNDGDADLFVDDDGTCYLVYTDWVKRGDVVVEQLDAAYHSGTGKTARLGQSATEAPSLFRRNNLYYVTYSDPNCGYCGGTGTSYKVASAPLGPWMPGPKISGNSCGGQPNHVSILAGRTGPVYIFQSDLWLNGNPTETLANQFWAPLSFDANGKILNIACSATATLN